MYYYDNGTKITSYSDSISYTAYTYDDFDSFTVYVNTTTGVSDSISVNFHFVRYAEAAIKWEYTGAVIRKITQNGKTIRSGLSTEIEFQVGGDLTDSAYDTITGLVNSYDGKTYILSGSSLIRVYRPSDNSTIGNYDTYSDFDALCNVAGWTTSTLNAFESARTIEISYQAPKAVEGNLGVGMFDLAWVQAVIKLFSLFGWALFVVGLVVCIFDVAIEQQTGRTNIRTTAMNVIKGFFAVSLFSVLPVELYKLCVNLQNVLSHDLSSIFAGQAPSFNTLAGAASSCLSILNGVPSLFNLFVMIALACCIVKIFFANIKRGGILLVQIAVGIRP